VDPAAAKAIEVAPGQRVRADIQIARTAGIRLTGQIVHSLLPPGDSGALVSTSVFMRPEHDLTDNGPTGSVTGDRYEFTNVLPGTYTFFAVTHESHSGPGGSHTPVQSGPHRWPF
jgi:hypothetical protein